MAVELITGHSGEAHISSEDVGELIAGLVGSGAYVLADPSWTAGDARNDGLEATLNGTSTVTVGTGEVLWGGRHVRVTAPVTLDIPSGSGTYGCYPSLHYTLEEGIEAVELVMTTEATQGEIGSGEAWLNLHSIQVSGSTVGDPVALLRTVRPYEGVEGTVQPSLERESVSLSGAVSTANNPSCPCRVHGTSVTVTMYWFALISSLASGGSVVIGTVPEGYRPPGTIVKGCSTKPACRPNVFVEIAASGAVTLCNHSGSAVDTSTKLAFTATYTI